MNLKTQLIAIVLIIISVSSVRAQYAIGIFGGVNNSNLTGDAPLGSTYESDLEFGVGALVEYNITSDVRISLQPMFQRKGTIIVYSVFS